MSFCKMNPPNNIIFVKVGDLYSYKHVNKLYNDLIQYFPYSKFWCYTDDWYHINNYIYIINPISSLKKWWPKLALFSEAMPYRGSCLFFDLDINIKDYFSDKLFWDGLTILNNYSKKDLYMAEHAYDVTVNSSVITWKAKEQDHIWNHFCSNKDYFMRKYSGIDRFIVHEKFNYNLFEDGLVSIVKDPKPNCPIDLYNGLMYEL